MAIEFVCPACGGTLQVGDDSAGRVIRCGACMTALTVPSDGRHPPPFDAYEVDRPAPPPPAPPPRPRDPEPDAEPRETRRRRDRDDYDDRPRRRPRAAEPPAPGRGVFFWLVIVGAVMLLGTGACCGGFFLLLPGAEWRKHESKEGFSVELPAKPQAKVAQAAKINLKDTRSEGAVLLKRGAAQFIVFTRDIDSEEKRLKRQETDEQVIEKEFGLLLAAMQEPRQRGEKPPAGEPSPYGGFDGREFRFEGRSGHYTARVIVADTRVYLVVGGGGVADWGDADVTRFLRSFEITNPDLKKVGERRADAKKKDAPKDDAKKDAEPNEPKGKKPKPADD